MSITSLTFAGFVAVVLAVYYVLPRRPQNLWLLLASYAFYITLAWQFAVVLAIFTFVNFSLARAIGGSQRRRRGLLVAGIAFNVVTLAVFKYADFYLPGMLQFLDQLGIVTRTPAIQILLPIGLSYMVLETISYLVDVYRKQIAPTANLLDFALYLAYFPKLVSGPIERANTFLPKLESNRTVDDEAFYRGVTLIVVGAVRKLVFADMLALIIPQNLFSSPTDFSAPELAAWLVAYAYALYNDFAGYTSIVRGVSALFGIELSPNFKLPFFARNFTEFWNRWHATLSYWLRDYIYFPASRFLRQRTPRRTHVLNVIVPPLATMLVSAMWHRATLSLLIWGALHGIYQIVYRIPTLSWPIVPPDKQPLWRQGLGIASVFTLSTLAWVPFNTSLPETLAFWTGLLDWSGMKPPEPRILVFLVPAVLVDFLQARQGELTFLRWPVLARAVALAGAILAILITTNPAIPVTPFVYEGF